MKFFSLWLSEEIVKSGDHGLFTTAGDRKFIPCKVYKNPTKQELLATLKTEKLIQSKLGQTTTGVARAFLTASGDLYIWPESFCLHDEITNHLKIDYEEAFYIHEDLKISAWSRSYVPKLSKILNQNKNWRTMMELPALNLYKPQINNKKKPRFSWDAAMKPFQKPQPGGLIPLPTEESTLSEALAQNAIYNYETWDSVKPTQFPYKIFKNPSKEELFETIANEKQIIRGIRQEPDVDVVGVARGILTYENDIYIWPESAKTHQNMAHQFGLNATTKFYVFDRVDVGYGSDIDIVYPNLNLVVQAYGDRGDPVEALKNNKNYQKMLGFPTQSPHLNTKKQFSWDNAMKAVQKPQPGGAARLPYESKYVVPCDPE